jgi:Cys-tRNA(Pro) deacylase
MLEPDPAIRVQRELDRVLPGTRVIHFDVSTHTSAEAAAAVGCDVGAIVKSLLFLIDGRPLLVLAPGDRQVSDQLLAARMGVGRKRVKMGDPAAVQRLTGYAVGGVPPLGHPEPLDMLMDSAIERFLLVYAAAGTASSVFPVSPADLRRITGADVADITRP